MRLYRVVLVSWRHADPSPNRRDPRPVDDEEQVVAGRCHVAVWWREGIDRSRRGPGDGAAHESLRLVPAMGDGPGRISTTSAIEVAFGVCTVNGAPWATLAGAPMMTGRGCEK